MDATTSPRVRQALKELQIKEADAFFAANAKALPKEAFNRKMLVAVHEQGRLVAEQELPGKYQLEKLVLGSSSAEAGVVQPASGPVEELPFSSLKEIFLPQLEIDKRHCGRVLFGTFCVQPFKLSSLRSVLADKSGKAVRVSICNLPLLVSSKEIEARFAMGSKVAIKEPHFKLCTDGKVMISVENPAELVLVDDSNNEIVDDSNNEIVDDSNNEVVDNSNNEIVDDSNNEIVYDVNSLLQELEKIRAEGNLLFRQQKWSGAIEQYSACIARCNTVVGGVDNKKIKQCLILAFSNRSEVWLQVSNYKNALDDANKALQFDAEHDKSISRRDRAWLGFGKLQHSVNVRVDDPFVGNLKRRKEKDVLKGKPKDPTPPSTASRVKLTESKDNSPPTKGKGTDLTNSSLCSDISKAKATGRTSISPSPNASKIKLVESKDSLRVAGSTPSKGKFSDAMADPPRASKGKSTSSSKRKPAVASIALGVQAADSEEDSCLLRFSKAKSTDTDETELGSTVIDGRSAKSSGDSDADENEPGSTFIADENEPGSTFIADENEPGSTFISDENDPGSTFIADENEPGSAFIADDNEPGSTFIDGKSAKSSGESDVDENEPGSTFIDGRSAKSSGDSDADENVTGSTFIDRRSAESTGDSSVSPWSSKDGKCTTPPPEELDELEEMEEILVQESQNPGVHTLDCEGHLFATWLDSFRSSGDALLSQGKWVDAIANYDRVTEFNPTKKNRDRVIQTLLMAYSHRSEAWIWLGNHENSLKDANAALEFVDRYPKSVAGYDAKHLLNEVRRGRAFHGLGEYAEACSIFNAALVKSPNDKFISDLLQKSQICYQQSRDGVYELDDYFLSGCINPPPPCSDFVGSVEIRPILGKGRGLFVTRDVHAGDLLLVSNPLAVVRRRQNRRPGGGKDGDEDFRFLTTKWRRNNNGHPLGLDDFVGRLALLQSKRTRYQLYSLCGGGPGEETAIPDINVFIPGSQFQLPEGWENLHTDQNRLRSIVILNAIDGGLNPLGGVRKQDDEDEGTIGCVGLWVLPSFMNHSCIPNCHMIDVGNAMFVRASRTILKGEELTRAYFNVYLNGYDRHLFCEEWLFACNCERCALEKALTMQRVLPLHEYRKLLENVRAESLKRLRIVERDRSLSLLLPSPQPALLLLREFADWFDGLLSRAEGLGNKEKAWIGASHLEAYTSRFAVSKDKKHFMLALENVLEFMSNTAVLGMCHSENALARASQLLEMVNDVYGAGSQTYRRIETRVLDLYRTAYGALRKEVLLTISRLIR